MKCKFALFFLLAMGVFCFGGPVTIGPLVQTPAARARTISGLVTAAVGSAITQAGPGTVGLTSTRLTLASSDTESGIESASSSASQEREAFHTVPPIDTHEYAGAGWGSASARFTQVELFPGAVIHSWEVKGEFRAWAVESGRGAGGTIFDVTRTATKSGSVAVVGPVKITPGRPAKESGRDPGARIWGGGAALPGAGGLSNVMTQASTLTSVSLKYQGKVHVRARSTARADFFFIAR